uniref:Uncharacterized protein n=1 Tax=Meleagris gallopavo TaxID=9103 RepID=A0A803YQ78_MELGA
SSVAECKLAFNHVWILLLFPEASLQSTFRTSCAIELLVYLLFYRNNQKFFQGCLVYSPSLFPSSMLHVFLLFYFYF